MKNFLLGLWNISFSLNDETFLNLLDANPKAKILDIGCGDGTFTLRCANKVMSNDICVLEKDDEFINIVKNKCINVIKCDINSDFPIGDNSFDIVTSNQVIEHLVDVDNYIKEIHRILKPNGYAIISTENLSSWHNIFALLLGYRAFSQGCSSRVHIGNPMSPHFLENTSKDSMTHIKIFPYRAFKEIFQLYGFRIDKYEGNGYYPFPTKSLMKIMAKIDPIHTHFITLKVRK